MCVPVPHLERYSPPPVQQHAIHDDEQMAEKGRKREYVAWRQSIIVTKSGCIVSSWMALVSAITMI